MRLSKRCRQLVGVEALYAHDPSLTDAGLMFWVRLRWRKPRCGGCTRCAPAYDQHPARDWRHIAVGSNVLWLRYAPWRVDLPALRGDRRTCAVGAP